MELRGEFRSVSEILDLIQIVSMGKKSGEVNFRSSKGSITLCFHQGKAANFDSGIPTVSQIKEAAASGKLPFTEAVKLLLLTISMGPMGEFLVDETLEELEVENLPPDMITMFIDSLIDKIPETCLIEGQSCRKRFREEFEKILRGG